MISNSTNLMALNIEKSNLQSQLNAMAEFKQNSAKNQDMSLSLIGDVRTTPNYSDLFPPPKNVESSESIKVTLESVNKEIKKTEDNVKGLNTSNSLDSVKKSGEGLLNLVKPFKGGIDIKV